MQVIVLTDRQPDRQPQRHTEIERDDRCRSELSTKVSLSKFQIRLMRVWMGGGSGIHYSLKI